jgi:hypothetical protein
MLKGGAADDDDLSEESVRAALQHAAASRNMRHPTAAMRNTAPAVGAGRCRTLAHRWRGCGRQWTST